jgi:hypothetical protein
MAYRPLVLQLITNDSLQEFECHKDVLILLNIHEYYDSFISM